MKKMICMLLAAVLMFTLGACGAAKPSEPESREWTRAGCFTDENDNLLSITRMDDTADTGWYVCCMLGEDLMEDSWGGFLPQEGNTLHGSLPSSGSMPEITVTVSEEGEDGLLLVIDGGETYHFKKYDMPEAKIAVTIKTEGLGNIAYAEGEKAPEIDPEYPFQSAYIGLAEPAVHTFAAWPQAGNVFVKWTKNGEDYSTRPQITLFLDVSAEYIAVFEEDPDWQNPVMNFIGEYKCDQAHALVECFGYDEAWITIEQPGDERRITNWIIFGRLDTDDLRIEYDGCSRTEFVYGSDGEIISDESGYEDVPGFIAFSDDGSFTWHRGTSEAGEDKVFEWAGRTEGTFSYIHDPRDNPEAMADILENPEAVYGFSPDPESVRLGSYAEYDWTDPEFVAQAQEQRRAYHESMESMTDILYKMRDEGASVEEMARAVSAERNRIRLAACENDPKELAKLKESNMDTYGHEDGPTPDELFEKYGSWTTVLQKAFSPNMGMDACCGLYDEYYQLYIELGYVE